MARKRAVSGSCRKESVTAEGNIEILGKAVDKGKLLVIDQHQKPLTETELELSRLRRELAEIRMERDLLKNVLY